MPGASVPSSQTRLPHFAGLRIVAAFEFAKGLLVLLAGFGLISLIYRNVNIEDVAGNFLHFLHIGPDRHLFRLFVAAAARFDAVNLTTVAMVAALYCVLRFVESYGLWKGRAWAQWVALLSGVVYLPLEIYGLIHKPTMHKWALLSLNVAIVAYMVYVRIKSHGIESPLSETGS